MKRIVFIESSDIGVGYSGRAARELGYEPLFLCDLRHYQADPRAQLAQFDVIDGPTETLEDVLRAISPYPDIQAITSLADKRMRVARATAFALGVAGLDPAVTLLKDKVAVQRLVPEFSPRSLDFELATVPKDELHALLSDGHGVIIKPVDSAGGLGLIHLRDESDVASLGRSRTLESLPHALLRGRWIAQSFVPGDLISAEGFVLNGFPRIIGFSKRKKVAATESASTFPADALLDPAARATADDAVKKLIERSGFKHGYFHIEFIARGPRCTLIDANVGRMGGGSVGEQVALAYELDPVDVYKHVILTSLFPEKLEGTPESFVPPPGGLHETFAVLYGLEKGGRLRALRVPKGESVFHTQILGIGADVSPMGRDDWSWIGILSGRTDDLPPIVRGIEIVTDDGVFTPYY